MYPLNDNDLDRLSREAADQYDVEPSTSGWEALEHRLNKELPLKEDGERRRFLFWLFLIVVLAGGGVLWTMARRDQPSLVQMKGTNTIPVSKEQEVSREVEGSNSDATAHRPTAANDPAAVNGSAAAAGKPASGTQAAVDDHTQSATTAKNSSRHDRKAPGGQSLQASTGLANQAGATVPVAARVKRQTAPVDQEPAAGIAVAHQEPADKAGHGATAYRDPQASQVQGADLHPGKPGAIQAPPLMPAVENRQAASPGRPRPSKGWELGLLAGPDMSNVRFTDADKVGYNMGLQVAYRFSDRWSVNTGGIYTRKNYTARGKDFTKPNTNYWDQADVKKVAGYCSMFDIPLNVRYDFPHNKKTRWFVSAGASTYIMTSEYYTINYLYNGLPRVHPYESDSATQVYPFAVFNFSAGFERKLNKRLSLQAEPYFKLPTRGLGYGKLDLSSYGLYFSLRYQLHP